MAIVGHQKQWEFLKRSAQNGKLAQAYLFYGPSHIGKRRVAIEFAKYLNCQNNNLKNRPCQVCQTCYQIEKKAYPDLIPIEPEDDKKSVITIAQIRDLKSRMSLHSLSEEKYKVAIIDQAHLLTHDAQSALLKQLEEPKGRSVIILITEYPENLLPTIISRCQKLRFWLISTPMIKEYLLKQTKIEKDRIEDLSLASLGKPGLVFNYLLYPEEETKRRQRIEDILELKGDDFYHRFNYVKKILKEDNIEKTFEIWLTYFRELMHQRLKPNNQLQEGYWNLFEIKKIINSIQEFQHLISTTNINKKLALELFLMEI
jgi:DNA polymerase-3 subunit delta'